MRPTPSLRLAPLAALLMLAGAGPARAQEPAPKPGAAASSIRDDAGMFGDEARRKARAELERIERETGVPVTIRTIDSLQGEDLQKETQRLAAETGVPLGVFVLIPRRDRKIHAIASRDYARAMPVDRLRTVNDGFVEGFRRGDFDEGLAKGVEALGAALAKARQEGTLPDRAAGAGAGAGGGSLVLRNQVRLTLAGARRIIAGSEAKASEMGIKANIAVVDDGGHPLAFARMDGARPASAYTATTKAVTAATFRQASCPLPAGCDRADVLLSLSLQNAALASGGRLTTLYGGVPVEVDGQVIGGVGIGGGTGEQDAEIARAGINALLDELKGGPQAPPRPKDTIEALREGPKRDGDRGRE